MSDEPEKLVPKAENATRKLALGAAVALVAAVGTYAFLHQRAENRRQAALAAEAQQKEVARAATRKACKLAPDAPLHEPVSIKGECQKAALEELSTPGSVTFPGMLDEDAPLVSPDGCVQNYRSWMIAPDTTTQDKKQLYLCTFDPRTGVATVTLF